MLKKQISEIVKQSIDIHLHIGPEVLPRKYTIDSLVKEETSRLGGCVLKNHFYPTVNLINDLNSKDMKICGSLVLNNFVGGLNPDAIYGASLISKTPLFVWLPTIHTKQFLDNSEFEIPSEWVGDKNFVARKSKDIKPVMISKDGKLVPEVASALKSIADTNSILCTGHISWQESVMVVNEAIRQGVKKIVLTHPIYQRINMPIEVQKDLAKAGCYIEHCYSMFSIDKISIEKMVEQMYEVGVNSIITSSDVGQVFSPSPSDALVEFGQMLISKGMSIEDFDMVCNINSNKLI